MYPYVAPHTAKIHTLITLGIRHRAKPLVFKSQKRPPRGFDSHRPLHFSLPGVSPRCPRPRLRLSLSSHSLDAATTVPLIECVEVSVWARILVPSLPVVIGRESAKIVALRFPHFSACNSVRSGRSNGTDFHPHNVDI
jgi:hypothetical protein